MGEVQRSVYFSVFRREIMFRAAKTAQDYSVIPQSSDDFVDEKCFYFGDFIIGFLPLLYGKMIHIDAPICVWGCPR